MNYKIVNLEEEEVAKKYKRLNKKIDLDELEERATDEPLEPLRKEKEYFETMVDTSASREAVNKLHTTKIKEDIHQDIIHQEERTRGRDTGYLQEERQESYLVPAQPS